jgi:hypothetical protein
MHSRGCKAVGAALLLRFGKENQIKIDRNI